MNERQRSRRRAARRQGLHRCVEHVADVVLLNTCSVRDNAEQKAINKMENLAGPTSAKPGPSLGFSVMAQSRARND